MADVRHPRVGFVWWGAGAGWGIRGWCWRFRVRGLGLKASICRADGPGFKGFLEAVGDGFGVRGGEKRTLQALKSLQLLNDTP